MEKRLFQKDAISYVVWRRNRNSRRLHTGWLSVETAQNLCFCIKVIFYVFKIHVPFHIITARNEVTPVCQSFCSQAGVCHTPRQIPPRQTPPWADTPLPGRHPHGQTPPMVRHPQAETPLCRHPRADTPVISGFCHLYG